MVQLVSTLRAGGEVAGSSPVGPAESVANERPFFAIGEAKIFYT